MSMFDVLASCKDRPTSASLLIELSNMGDGILGIPNGRGPSSCPSSGPTTRCMAKRIQEDWDSTTHGRETFLYMFKEHHKK